jgi:predicted metal-binding membrane protein
MTLDGTLEGLLRRDRWLVVALLAAIAAASWAWVLSGAGMGMSAFDMTRMGSGAAMEGMGGMGGMGGMDGMGGMGATAPAAWSPGYALLMLAMWWVMMVAMMLPAAAPMVLLFAAIQRRQRRESSPHVPTSLFLLSYLVVWGAFSLAAVALQWGLAGAGLLRPDMALGGAALGAGLLIAAGLYQLTPLKQACLRQCQHPARFLAEHWRKGAAGAMRMGLAHGAYCLGCCWFLMLLLFVGGVMNLYWIGGLALYVLFEKLVPAGHWLSHAAGLMLMAAGAWLFAAALQ